jgi:hypothetical protein
MKGLVDVLTSCCTCPVCHLNVTEHVTGWS